MELNPLPRGKLADRVQSQSSALFTPVPSPFTSRHDLGPCLPLPGSTLCFPLLVRCPTVTGTVISNRDLLWVSSFVPVRKMRKHCKSGLGPAWTARHQCADSAENYDPSQAFCGHRPCAEGCQVTRKPASSSAAVPASPAVNNSCKQKSALPVQSQKQGCLSDGASGGVFQK